MINPQALETFGGYDKKSLMAGVVVGQGLKGRARAAQTPAPAGFPQELWDAAAQRANNMIASMQGAGQSAGTPETPDDWQFDKDAFCFGIAAGRSLEGWEIDGFASPDNPDNPEIPEEIPDEIPVPDDWSLIMYYVHVDIQDTVYVRIGASRENTQVLVDWGDKSQFETFRLNSKWEEDISIYPHYSFWTGQCSHLYDSGDYVITLISKKLNGNYGAYRTSIYPFNNSGKGGVHGTEGVPGHLGYLRAAYMAGDIPVIAPMAFRECDNLQHCTIMSQLYRIFQYAFYGCRNLINVTMPNALPLEVRTYAFFDCVSLTTPIPNIATTVGKYAFARCNGLSNIILPEGLRDIYTTNISGNNSYKYGTRVAGGMFAKCTGLTSVTIPNGVTIIGDGGALSHNWSVFYPEAVFENCTSLTSVTIPNSVTHISNDTFHGCTSLTSVTIPNSVTFIGENAFRGCTSLTNVTMPNSATHIYGGVGGGVFQDCTSLTSIVIPDGLVEVPIYFVRGCTNLSSITIPSGVQTFDYPSFFGCESLADIYYGGTEEQWNQIEKDIWKSTDGRRESYEVIHHFEHVTIHYNSTGPDDVHDD